MSKRNLMFALNTKSVIICGVVLFKNQSYRSFYYMALMNSQSPVYSRIKAGRQYQDFQGNILIIIQLNQLEMESKTS